MSWSSQSLSVMLSLVVLKDKISVLGLGLGLQGQVLGPAKDEKLHGHSFMSLNSAPYHGAELQFMEQRSTLQSSAFLDSTTLTPQPRGRPSPTTEHGAWRRPTIVDGLLAVQRDVPVKAGVTSVVELEIRPCEDTLLHK